MSLVELHAALILGVTATRKGLTPAQREWAYEQLRQANTLHHGACVGGDETMHDLAVKLGLKIVIHPPDNTRLMMPKSKFFAPHDVDIQKLLNRWPPPPTIVVMPALPYLARNRNIVGDSRKLLVLPDGPERLQSGTWSTFRYARRIGKKIDVCYPSGELVMY